MQAGELDRQIILKQPSTAQSGSGAVEETFTPLASGPIWAGVQYGRGRKYVSAARINAEVAVVFTIRYREDITEAWRIGWDGLDFDIISIAEEERKEGLIIAAKGVQP